MPTLVLCNSDEVLPQTTATDIRPNLCKIVAIVAVHLVEEERLLVLFVLLIMFSFVHVSFVGRTQRCGRDQEEWGMECL